MQGDFVVHRKFTEWNCSGIEFINYFEVEKDSIDSVLDIFVRVNSGGTVLSKSDLLFSTIVSHWDKARDEIDKLLFEINKKGEGFKFSNDFIMRTCSISSGGRMLITNGKVDNGKKVDIIFVSVLYK